MNPLSSLVNYSDDENSSSASSDDERQVSHPTKTVTETKEKAPEPNQKLLNERTETVSERAVPTNDLPRSVAPNPLKASTVLPLDNKASDYNRRLLAAIAPKPIEGIDNFGIPDEPTEPCDPERVERIAHFLSLRASGHRLNHHLQRNKAFHNPRIYTKLVEFTEVDEIGSNFDKTDYDPHGFPKEMYIDGILETQKRLAEEKAAQQQNRTAVNFVPPQHQQPASAAQLTEQQSAAMAQAMATAARVASRIARPPVMNTPSAAPTTTPEKRRNKWDDTSSSRRDKRR